MQIHIDHSNKTVIKTGIKAGDLVNVILPNTGGILFSVSRSMGKQPKEATSNSLVFPGGDDKMLLNSFVSHDKKGVCAFIELLCHITGLQANLNVETDSLMTFKMEEGEGLIVRP